MWIEFHIDGQPIKVPCQESEAINEIFPRCETKLQKKIDMRFLNFIYNGKVAQNNIPLAQVINEDDRNRNILCILVNQNDFDQIAHNIVTCPKCLCEVDLSWQAYKAKLKCPNGHFFNNLSVLEFEKTQELELSKIVCDICKQTKFVDCLPENFKRCSKCKINLCKDCEEIHLKEFNKKKRNKHLEYIKEFKLENFQCLIHKKNFNSFCQICEKDLCCECRIEHQCGKIKEYSEMISDINELSGKRENLKKYRKIFNEQVNEIIEHLNELKNNIDSYIELTSDLLDKFNPFKTNYKMIQNIKSINLDEAIYDLTKINLNDDLINKFKDMMYLNKKIKYADEITLIYKINPGATKIKIFDEDFVKENSDKCYIIVNDIKTELKSHLYINQDFQENTLQIMVILKNINNIVNMKNAFKETSLMSTMDISKFDMINVSSLESTFEDCKYLDQLPKLEWDIKKVKSLKKMFCRCESMKSLYLKNWNTKNVIDMSNMFQENISLLSIKGLETFDTSSCENMESMFLGCKKLDNLEDISKWETLKLENMSSLFKNCSSLENIPDISKWDVSNVKDAHEIFYGCESLISLPDISSWDTSNFSDIQGAFCKCSSITSLPDISSWKLKNVNSLANLFANCQHLLKMPDISGWDMSNITNISHLFDNCHSLESLPDIIDWNISNVEKMNGVFNNCYNLKYMPDISKWNTSNVKEMSNLFAGCKNLTYLPDISNWITNNVTKMNLLFNECSNLEYLPKIDNWDMSNVVDITSMFRNCSSLVSLPDISKWDVSNITSMRSLFCGCKLLEAFPDFSDWNMGKVRDISWMFYDCISLNNIPDITNWNIKDKVKKFEFFKKKSVENESQYLGVNLMNIENINIQRRQYCLQTGMNIPYMG